MSKFKNILFGLAATLLLAFGMAGAAYAADTLNNGMALNEASADIPISQIVKAGASVDLSEIKYKITVAPKIYSPKPTEEGVYVYGGTVSNSPITINADNSADSMTAGADYVSEDAIKTWDYTRSLTDLFGVIDDTNFPQAGMYEFTITDEIEGGTSGDASKWTHTRPEYLLQVLVKNTIDTNGKVTGRAFAGWTLSKKNGTTYEKVNSGADNQDGKAEFESDYIGKSTLNVTKKVAGDYASTTHPFEQTITLYLPDWASATDVESATGPAGALTTSDTGKELSYTVSLKHGETASFVVPVGTRYKVQETTRTDGKAVDSAGLSYTPKIDWTISSPGNSAETVTNAPLLKLNFDAGIGTSSAATASFSPSSSTVVYNAKCSSSDSSGSYDEERGFTTLEEALAYCNNFLAAKNVPSTSNLSETIWSFDSYDGDSYIYANIQEMTTTTYTNVAFATASSNGIETCSGWYRSDSKEPVAANSALIDTLTVSSNKMMNDNNATSPSWYSYYSEPYIVSGWSDSGESPSEYEATVHAEWYVNNASLLKTIADDISEKGTSSEYYEQMERLMLADTPFVFGDDTHTYRLVDIYGQDKEDGSKAGLTFMAKHTFESKALYNDFKIGTEYSTWTNSDLRSSLNSGEIYALFPQEITENAVATKVQSATAYNTTDNPGVSSTYEKFWIPSFSQIFGTETTYNAAYPYYMNEGSQMKLFADNDVSYDKNNLLLKKGFITFDRTDDFWDNDAMMWILRTPYNQLIISWSGFLVVYLTYDGGDASQVVQNGSDAIFTPCFSF